LPTPRPTARRPKTKAKQEAAILATRKDGAGILKTAKQHRVGTSDYNRKAVI
jgi:hypothetical protein